MCCNGSSCLIHDHNVLFLTFSPKNSSGSVCPHKPSLWESGFQHSICQLGDAGWSPALVPSLPIPSSPWPLAFSCWLSSWIELSDGRQLGLAAPCFCDAWQHLPAVFIPSLDLSPCPLLPVAPPVCSSLGLQNLLCTGHRPQTAAQCPAVPARCRQATGRFLPTLSLCFMHILHRLCGSLPDPSASE